MGDRILLNELEKGLGSGLGGRSFVVCRWRTTKTQRELFREKLFAPSQRRRGERNAGSENDPQRTRRWQPGRDRSSPTTFAALKENRVRRLLVSPMDDVSYWRCGSCGASGARAEPCSVRIVEWQPMPNIPANEFMDLAFPREAAASNSPVRTNFMRSMASVPSYVGRNGRWEGPQFLGRQLILDRETAFALTNRSSRRSRSDFAAVL